MKKTSILIVIICCMAMLFSSVCLAETTASAEDMFSGFTTTLDYASANNDMIECSILIEALEGSFKADVAAEEIIVKVRENISTEFAEDFDPETEFADVSEIAVVSNDGAMMEVNFVMPKGELNADEFAIQAYVSLADGVMMDADGNAVGKMSELIVWEMNEADRASKVTAEHDYTYSYLQLEHSGAYAARFYVSWDEFTGYDSDGNMTFERRDWSDNGKKKTAGFRTTIQMKNAYNISIKARVKTGLVWDPWQTIVARSGLEFELAELELMGIPVEPEYAYRHK